MRCARLVFIGSVLLVGSAFAACGGDDTAGSASNVDAGLDATSSDATATDAAAADATASDAGSSDANAHDAAVDGAIEASCTYDETSNGTASVLGIYTLPATSMQVMNPFLTQQQLTTAVANGAGTVDDPGPGSGLDYVSGCPGTFWMIGDRGPNGDTANGGKLFPLPAYTPAALRVQLVDGDAGAGAITIDGVVPIVDDAGVPVTGLPNEAADDVPYASPDAATPLPYTQAGLDTEDVKRMPNGDLAFVEEYSPSAGIIDGVTGKVKVRYVPSTVSLPNAGYRVASILPAVLTNRRSNKGLEGLAVSPDGHTAFVVLQAPMGDDSSSTYGNSLVNRVIRIDHFDDPSTATVGGHFIVLHEPIANFPGTNKQSKVYYNSAAWISATKVLLLERGTGISKLVVADFSAATNLLGNPAKGETSLTPEAMGVVALGITAATTTEAFTSVDTPTFITSPPMGAIVPDKLEGVAIINRTTVAISNDNDFGIIDPNDRSRIWVLRLKAPLPM